MKILKLAFCRKNAIVSNEEENLNFASIVFVKMSKNLFCTCLKGGTTQIFMHVDRARNGYRTE